MPLVDISEWENKIATYLGGSSIAFDNLALKQLDIQDKVSKKIWDKCYMGDDGRFSMYLDAVKQEFASSSTSFIRYKCNNLSIKEMFDIAKIENID